MNSKKKTILHLCTFEKFTNEFLIFNERNCGDFEHRYYVLGYHEKKAKYSLPKIPGLTLFPNNLREQIVSLYNLAKSANEVDKILVHGLFNTRLLIFLCLNLQLVKKSYWMMWGADLYVSEKKGFRNYLLSKIRKRIIRNFAGVLTYLKGDFEYAKNRWGLKGEFVECIMYPSNIYRKVPAQARTKKEGCFINLLVGNSADITNNHFEILDRLKGNSDKRVQIYIPLSYGNENYREKVIKYSKKLFSENVHHITEFMSLENYLSFINKIDIAVFNHKRQQAMGITINLIGQEKTVYIRNDVSQWCFFKELGITVLNSDNVCLETISPQILKENSKKIQDYFSEENYLAQLINFYSA